MKRTMQLDGPSGYNLSPADALQHWLRKVDAQAFAKAQGWNNSDVVPVHYNKWWKGWAVGCGTIPGTFRGFDCNGELVDVTILPPRH